MLDVHRAQLSADDLHGVRDALRLHLALRSLLALDLDLGVFPLEVLRRGQLARYGIGNFGGILNVANDDAADDERTFGRVRLDADENRCADGHELALDVETVAALYLIARKRAQRLAD